MEEILASIKRIIAEDGVVTPTVTRGRRGSGSMGVPVETEEAAMPQPAPKSLVDSVNDEEVLELTESVDSVETPQLEATTGEETPVPQAVAEDQTASTSAGDARIVSDSALNASRSALASLSAMIVKPDDNGDNTLDGLVREMLRPMLKEWLDARLPELVEKMVEKEIARITGRAF